MNFANIIITDKNDGDNNRRILCLVESASARSLSSLANLGSPKSQCEQTRVEARCYGLRVSLYVQSARAIHKAAPVHALADEHVVLALFFYHGR